MRKGRTLLVPPRSTPSPPPPPELYVEPDNDIELLGEMLHDVQTMGQLLAALPFDRDAYRGNLRIIAGAAVRTRARCSRLLGDPPADPEAVVERLADAIVKHAEEPTAGELAQARDIYDEVTEHSPNLQPPAAEPSNKIDAPDAVNDHRQPEATNSQLTRKNPADRPKKTGNGYTVVESFVMSELKDRGTATTTELLTAITALRRVPSKEVEDAIANLRITKRITTTRLGRGFLNRIAEGVA